MKNIINIRASSFAELFDCAARWEGKHILGLKSPYTGAARIGHAVHEATASYDLSRLHGNTPISIDDSISVFVDALHKESDYVQWGLQNPKQAEKIGIKLVFEYCQKIAPDMHYVGVEVPLPSVTVEGLNISLSGTTDRVRKTSSGTLGIVDLKSGVGAVDVSGAVTHGHRPQLGVYTLLTEKAIKKSLDAPPMIIGLSTTLQKVKVGSCEVDKTLLTGSEENKGLLQMASEMIHGGNFYPNPKSTLCSEQYCPRYSTCKYKG